MIEVKQLLRKAYIDKFASLPYMGVNIPIDDENLTKTPAEIPMGVGPGLQAYVLVQNQTLQNASAKCGVNQNTQLQLAVITLFTAGRGGNFGNFAHADLISSYILQMLFPNNTQTANLTLPGVTLWRAWLEGSTHIESTFETSREYTNILILNHSISQ